MRVKRFPGKLLLWSLVGLCLSTQNLYAQKFFPDDPLEKEPPPMPVMDAERRELSELLEWASGQFGTPGERHPEIGVIPGMGVNTLGEVMDGPWFQNRHGKKRMSLEELKRGTGDDRPPIADEPWKALTVKSVGLRPGILIADSELPALSPPVRSARLPRNVHRRIDGRVEAILRFGLQRAGKLHRVPSSGISSLRRKPVKTSRVWGKPGTSPKRTSITF